MTQPVKVVHPIPKWKLLGIIAAVLAAIGASAAIGSGPSGDSPASSDVKVESCAWDGVAMRATLQVANYTPDVASYSIEVEFLAGKTRVGTGYAYVDSLASSQQAVEDVVAFTSSPADSCLILDVNRY